MTRIKQKILAIDVVNVAIVTVSPRWRPLICKHKCVAAVLEAWPAFYDLGPMHDEVMLSPELGAEPVLGNAASAAGIASLILLPASLLSIRLLTPLIWSSRFLSVLFLLALPQFSTRLCFRLSLFLLALPHFPTGLCFLLFLLLLIGSRSPRLVLPRTVHFILPGLGLGLILLRLIPFRFFLSRFVVLLFFVLRVKNRRTRDQSRENP